MGNTVTINSQDKIAPCQMTVSKGGGDPYAKWINQTGASLTLRSDTIANYFNDANGNSITSPLTILDGNPSQNGGLKLQVKTGVTPPINLSYTIDSAACPASLGGGATDPSIDIQS